VAGLPIAACSADLSHLHTKPIPQARTLPTIPALDPASAWAKKSFSPGAIAVSASSYTRACAFDRMPETALF